MARRERVGAAHNEVLFEGGADLYVFAQSPAKKNSHPFEEMIAVDNRRLMPAAGNGYRRRLNCLLMDPGEVAYPVE